MAAHGDAAELGAIGGGEGGGGGEDPRAAALNAIHAIGDEQGDQAAALQERKRALLAEKKQLNKDVKNEERKKARRVSKAKSLSNDDLLTILASRVAAKAKPKAKAKAKAKGA